MRCSRALAVVTAALALALTACAEKTTGSTGAAFNEADVEFATNMIQHHAQALEMVDLTVGRELAPEVTHLTDQIRAVHAPEIEKLVDWLQEWGEPVPETSRDHANAHGSAGDMDTDMPGMMGAEDMAALEDALDDEFQDMWLAMMIEHHQGAVSMAQEEIENGKSKKAVTLAQGIAAAQEKRIETMRQLLDG